MKTPILAAALLVALPAMAQPAVRAASTAIDGTPVPVTLTNHGIFPARIPLRAGERYQLRFVNRSDRRHDFAVKSFFEDAQIQDRDTAKVQDGRVSLAPGEGATVRIIAPRHPGARYEFSSTQLQDANSGLKGNIFIR